MVMSPPAWARSLVFPSRGRATFTFLDARKRTRTMGETIDEWMGAGLLLLIICVAVLFVVRAWLASEDDDV